MSDSDEVTKVPDVPQTKLAFRVWRLDPRKRTLLSLNSGRSNIPAGSQASFFAKALSRPEGGWPPGVTLRATCGQHGNESHGPIPGKECSCGYYATTSLKVIRDYLSPDSPVMGIVEAGGRVIPASQGLRAEYMRVAAILLIEPVLSLPTDALEAIADFYDVPALVPPRDEAGLKPEYYRSLIDMEPGVGDEADEYLRKMTEGE